MKTRYIIICALMLLAVMTVRAEDETPNGTPQTTGTTETPKPKIRIMGNVYGGGNVGDMTGNTSVTVHAGDIHGGVYGGARQAEVGGNTFVKIDGEHISDDITINNVYGGNDVAGTIGTSTRVPSGVNAGGNLTDDLTTYNAFVLTTKEKTATTGETQHGIFIGQLFGGGNGDYNYITKPDPEDETKTVYVAQAKQSNGTWKDVATSGTSLVKPELAKTFVDIHGGTFGYLFGGGNNATVTETTNICIKNESAVTQATDAIDLTAFTKVEDMGSLAEGEINPVDQRLMEMGINLSTFFSNPDFQFLRVFGGNNKAPMHIRPKWHLDKGSIYNLYSGGNEGKMTSTDGLLLEIEAGSEITVENVYGGCRKADVIPLDKRYEEGGTLVPYVYNLTDKVNGKLKYHFPDGLAARTLIKGGNIRNVYGGNDISGKVYFGNAVGVSTSISGDIYGGGNGSYAYTDQESLKNDLIWGDYYYDPGNNSIEALNAHRPNAEQVSVRVAGTDADHPTIIRGSIYCGGNSATIKPGENIDNPMVHLKIGSYVIADKVFLGNNGENMIDASEDGVLAKYAGKVYNQNRQLTQFSSFYLGDSPSTSTAGLKNAATFASYMDGCAMEILPDVVFDKYTDDDKGDPATYIEYTSYFGSFFCGGNVGSIFKDGKQKVDFNHDVIIFDKLVGGCNTAYVTKSAYNAAYEGGLKGDPDDDGNKLELNLSGLKLQPKRWRLDLDPIPERYPKDIVWNTVKNYLDTNGKTIPVAWNDATWAGTDGDISADLNSTMKRRFAGGNIYGGCYTSGYINGNVVININGTIVDREGVDGVFDTATPTSNTDGSTPDPEILYGHNKYNITTRRTGVILNEQGMDPLGTALNVFGGGYGENTQIWGCVTINHNAGYAFQIFGGGELGVVGKGIRDANGVLSYDRNNDGEVNKLDYNYDANDATDPRVYNTTININGSTAGVSKTDWSNLSADDKEALAECEFVYGGGFEGLICGDTRINIGNCRLFNTFAGSCNADILGHTETYVGQWTVGSGSTATTITGFPWIRDNIYGGNDLGGTIYGSKSFNDRLSSRMSLSDVYGAVTTTSTPAGSDTPVTTTTYPVLNASAYMEYAQGRVVNIFGGCYGDYDYNNAAYSSRVGSNKPYLHNTFVNIRPINTTIQSPDPSNGFEKVFGAGQGHSGDREGDKMQDRSYVLIDIPDDMTNFRYSEIFGAGSYDGVGMKSYIAPNGNPTSAELAELDKHTAIIDLVHGKVGAAYGGSFNEGITRRTMVNVPTGSTINIGSIFGGAYGNNTLKPCDVYEGHVEYHSQNAWLIYNPERTEKVKDPDTGLETNATIALGDKRMKGAIYGGNNRERRTIYGKINIDVPVNQSHHQYGSTTGVIYGAGCGSNTWSEYTEVNLEDGAEVYEVYGGGEEGRVLNAESVQSYINNYCKTQDNTLTVDDPRWIAAWTIGSGYDPDPFTFSTSSTSYIGNSKTNLSNPLVRSAEMDNRPAPSHTYNTNVIIKKGAKVNNYAYGGGLGNEDISGSGDVYGTTYIALLGGSVAKDIFAAGTVGAVFDAFKVGAKSSTNPNGFTASANAYIEGGTLRNVYGGGWKGDVGFTPMDYTADGWSGTYVESNEVPGETNVVIGIRKDQASLPADYGFLKGEPAIQRNAYGGGEGGAVFGTSNFVLNNGHIGYVHLLADEVQDEQGKIVKTTTSTKERYEEKIHDETYKENGVWAGRDRLKDCGNVFGGGYDVRSCVDKSYVTMWGGEVRNSMHGGGEIATIGRGACMQDDVANSVRTLTGFYKAGETHVKMYNGHVKRNVFGGGKGYNIWGYGQQGTLYTDGYVFGQTEVLIHGGEIGTKEGVADGYGNVFGGGDIGFVYSKVSLVEGSHTESTGSPGHTYYYDGDDLTEDCKVIVSPYLQVKKGKTVSGYGEYEYVPTDYLNTLPKKNEDGTWSGDWLKLYTGADSNIENPSPEQDDTEERGVIIHNAVFAGGNVASNSDQHYANSKTVFGNVTATLYDVYHRDFITVGTEHIGGIYGGGNLSLVDGYRELNITNYGTDYYGMHERISLDEYHNLSNRERAYFKLEYMCVKEYTDTKLHKVDDRISEEDYLKLDEQYRNETYWKQFGFCSIYAGRLLNTIQRADLCGVYGSRMVLQGAKDRVAEVTENIDYTINRVGELSLNKQQSVAGDTNPDDAVHGNYFGIYSNVNYMGNLTSDVRFDDDYVNSEGTVSGKTFYSHKSADPTSPNRNIGTSKNEVALASGVFLELVTEKTELNADKKKEYGYITGVVELDLINVKRDIEGGGFVYAKNEHRVPKFFPDTKNALLSSYNKESGTIRDDACTYKQYCYSQADEIKHSGSGTTVGGGTAYQEMEFETSGNFIHFKKRIVDDCYPVNNRYLMSDAGRSEAHYWYIKGSVYVYDQVVSAYTGSANAYSKEVHMPLTITAASNGKLKLLNVKPNRYAYYYNTTNGKIGTGENEEDKKVWVNNQADAYELNDVITWWDWQNLPEDEQGFFVEDTYVNTIACKVDGTPYKVGEYVMLPSDIAGFKTAGHTITDAEGKAIVDKEGHELTGDDLVDEVFRSSNNIGHETGYVLTFDMDTPTIWDDYHTETAYNGTSIVKITESEYQARIDNISPTDPDRESKIQAIIDTYTEGPTFRPSQDKVLGRREYTSGQIITGEDYNMIDGTDANSHKDWIERAYVAKETVSYPDPADNSKTKTVNPGSGYAIPYSEWYGLSAEVKAKFGEAYICTNSVKLADNKYLLYGELITQSEIESLTATYSSLSDEITKAMTTAYVCTQTGEYGGRKYSANTNYSAIQSWCALSDDDRDFLTFNYDALDLFADPDYSVETTGGKTTYQAYDNLTTDDESKKLYSKEVGVEYVAVFKASGSMTSYSYSGGTLTDGQSITNDIYESEVRNDKRYYSRVNSSSDFYINTEGENVFYIANTNFVYDGEPYGKGQVVTKDVYTHNTGLVYEMEAGQTTGVFYCCFEDHLEDGTSVEKGTMIPESQYKDLTDDQQYFVIQGKEPTEVTTLYVNSNSELKDVTKEKIITVVYQYTYYEEDDNKDMKLTNELHVVNIHLQLESGAPTIGKLDNPPTVLPGDPVGLTAPKVTPGIVDVLTNGWELFSNSDDADHHRNGVPFTNNSTPVYWYQNGDHYIAFYSKTVLGKTYSNYVPLSVANYHDLDHVMKEKTHHLYVDRADVDRPSKIYIDNRDCESDPAKSELDLLKDFFDLSVGTQLTGHASLSSHVRAGRNLEFFLSSDVSPKQYTTANGGPGWSSIGEIDNPETEADEGVCFEGVLHGDGHTISGLSKSLFNNLCGEVYNLGVMGSFNGAGIVETGTGYVENCWISTNSTLAKTTKPVFGQPLRRNDVLRGDIQIVNSYYQEEDDADDAIKYTNHDANSENGTPVRKNRQAFYNGEVAYDLNGFYLKKRYWHGIGLNSGTEYQYLPVNPDGSLSETMTKGYYPDSYAVYQPMLKQNVLINNVLTNEVGPYMGYVESRFYDGDYRYAAGEIPSSNDIRQRMMTVTVGTGDDAEDVEKPIFTPIWPDDYLFFGQTLTYDHMDGEDGRISRAHQDWPSSVNRLSGRIMESTAENNGNRVYRAPAYIRSGVMDVAHFNSYAVFAQSKKNTPSIQAYKGMTAIDFTGHNDIAGNYVYGWAIHQTDSPYWTLSESEPTKLFFPPLLDDDGLSKFQNIDLTQNLLAYTMTSTTAAAKTNSAVALALPDEAYEETETAPSNSYSSDTYRYHTVAYHDPKFVKGHHVELTNKGYEALNDHFLVDKQDFNAPIGYSFGNNYRMWYQRKPEKYVDVEWSGVPGVAGSKRTTKGWEGISLPFKAEIVTTDEKGEITHFYDDGENGNNAGHEYWLRGFDGGAMSTETGKESSVFVANFRYPMYNSSDGLKEYENTFLWDFYYSYKDYDDKNYDDYQEDDSKRTYYRTERDYANYPRLAGGMPYIIGFPGKRYYEFDLSGEFSPENTVEDRTTGWPSSKDLKAQTITFASKPGATDIYESDGETVTVIKQNGEKVDAGVTKNGYTFKANYLNNPKLKAGATDYLLNSDGNSYVVDGTNLVADVDAFRPYFTSGVVTNARPTTRSIIFSNDDSELKGVEERGDPKDEAAGALNIYAKKHKIVVESSLAYTTDVRIVNLAGITINSFTIEPGETVETRINNAGVYIVEPTEARYIKKLTVR